MIDWLEINQLAIAERIAMEFDGGFTTVTGETGSGKSLIVGAVGMLLGDRSDNSAIRRGQEKAEIIGGFAVTKDHPARRWLRENDLDGEAGECILRRVVRRDKPSRAYINGRAVTASQLRELGRELVDIHGQNAHHSLLNRRGQLALLDNAAGNAEPLAQINLAYEKLAAARRHIAQLQARGDSARERAELLQFQTDELATLDPQADEWPRLEAQHKRMRHAHDLADGARAAAGRLTASEGGQGSESAAAVSTMVVECYAQLRPLAEYDSRIDPIIAMLEEADVNINEAAAQLQALGGEGALDPAEAAELEARFSLYHDLSRKHRLLPGLLAARLEALRAELDAAQNPEAELQHWREQADHAQADYDRLADKVSAKRAAAAPKLAKQVSALMQELGMAGGVFEIHLLRHGGMGGGGGSAGDGGGVGGAAGGGGVGDGGNVGGVGDGGNVGGGDADSGGGDADSGGGGANSSGGGANSGGAASNVGRGAADSGGGGAKGGVGDGGGVNSDGTDAKGGSADGGGANSGGGGANSSGGGANSSSGGANSGGSGANSGGGANFGGGANSSGGGANSGGAAQISRHGNESAQFMVSANPGLPVQPMSKVASGGELSRLSLAINVAMAAEAPASTLIFDEVDVGIGGKVAAIVGEKLRRLGDSRQVICITHLSQVAARGHHHWSVAKQTGAQASVTARPLDRQQRIEEIARMTAGAELTPQSLAHAESLMEAE